MDESIFPSEETRKSIYNFYLLTYESKFSIPKKRHLMTSAMGYEKWGWRVVGITKSAVIEIANNNFKKPKGLERDHFKKSRKDTFNEIFVSEKYNLEKWWEKVWENDETILMTKNEHNKHKNLNKDDVLNVDYKIGLFRANGIGMSFTKRDGEFVKELYERIMSEQSKI